jgi:hypothetical protein
MDGSGRCIIKQCAGLADCWSGGLCYILLCLLGSLAFLALAPVLELGLVPFPFWGLLGADRWFSEL